jgi:hypothetical protein
LEVVGADGELVALVDATTGEFLLAKFLGHRDPCHEFGKVPFSLTHSRERPHSLRVVKYPP